jgi:hypothetical protein
MQSPFAGRIVVRGWTESRTRDLRSRRSSARLLVLRRLVEQSKLLRVNLYDDLTPEGGSLTGTADRVALAASHAVDGCAWSWSAASGCGKPTRTWPNWIAVHCLGVSSGRVHNPGKYFAAVNSATSRRRWPRVIRSRRSPCSIVSRRWIGTKRCSVSAWPHWWALAESLASSPNAPHSIAGDLVPFIVVGAGAVRRAFVFELP